MPRPITRRDILKGAGCGFGYLALAGLTAQADAGSSGNPLAPRTPYARAIVRSGSLRIGYVSPSVRAKSAFTCAVSMLAPKHCTSDRLNASLYWESDRHSAVQPPVNANGKKWSITFLPL